MPTKNIMILIGRILDERSLNKWLISDKVHILICKKLFEFERFDTEELHHTYTTMQNELIN